MTNEEQRERRIGALALVTRISVMTPQAFAVANIRAIVDEMYPPVLRAVPNVVRVDDVGITGYPPGPYEFRAPHGHPEWRIMMRNGNASTPWEAFTVNVHLLPPSVLAAVAEVLTNPLKHEPDDGE